MRHIALVFFMVLLAFCQSVQAAADSESAAQRLVRLSNGLTVYIIKDDRFPLVCTRLYVRAGSANEDPAQAGISHVLEHMVFKGTESRPKGQIARDVESLGGYLNAATSFDKTWYLTDMPAAHWRMGMDVVRDMAFSPSLDPAELESEKDVVISELQRGQDEPMSRLFEALQTSSLQNTPYGRPIIGYEKTVRALTVQDLRNYIRHWYQPQNMMLLVAGQIEPEQVLAHAQKLFGDLRNHGDLPVLEPLDLSHASGGPLVEVVRGPWNKVYLGLSFPAPPLQDIRSADLDVLSYLLGGDGTSYLQKKYVYDKQLVDSISVSNMSLARAGLLCVIAQLEPGRVEPFWQDLSRDMAALKTVGFTPEALSRARFNLLDSMDRAGETLNGLVRWRGLTQFELGGEQGERNLRLALNDVNMARIEAAIGQWFVPERARIRVLAPEFAQLPDFGKILQANWPHVAQEGADSRGKETQRQREVVNLGPGQTVILVPDNTVPYVSLDLMLPGGNALLDVEQQGLAELTARLLTDGYGTLDRLDVERFFAERASTVSVRAGLQTFGISLTGPSRFNADYFTALGQMLQSPAFDMQELQREAEQMKAAIRQRADRPLAYAFSKLNPFLFPGGQPYGFDGLGSAESLDRLGRDAVRRFWEQQSRQPWVLAVAGSFDREAVLAFAASLPAPVGKGVPVAEPRWGQEKKLELHLPGRNQAHLLQIFRTVPADHPDAPALMLLQAVLSGQSGILFSRLRDEQGLGYSVTAFNRSMPEAGFMAFYIGSTPDRLAQARAGFAQVIAELKATPLTSAVLQAGVSRLWGDHLRDRQSLASRAGEAATDAVLHRPQDFQKKLLDRAAALTPEDVQAAARKYLVEGRAYELELLP